MLVFKISLKFFLLFQKHFLYIVSGDTKPMLPSNDLINVIVVLLACWTRPTIPYRKRSTKARTLYSSNFDQRQKPQNPTYLTFVGGWARRMLKLKHKKKTTDFEVALAPALITVHSFQNSVAVAFRSDLRIFLPPVSNLPFSLALIIHLPLPDRIDGRWTI